MKTFRKEYKEKYNLDTYSIECIAHTFNNIVHDILSFILFSEKDDKIISSLLNSENTDEFDDDVDNTNFEMKSKLILYHFINNIFITIYRIISKNSKNRIYFQISK